MHIKTHREIVEGVAKCIGLPEDYVNTLVHGVSLPDRKRKAGKRHHTVYGFKEALELVFRARREYLSGNTHEALELLGRALHHVHDALIGRRAHYYVERALRNTKISVACKDLEVLEPSISKIRRALDRRSPLSNYSEVLAEAVKLTAMLVNAVTWSPSKDFLDLLNWCNSIRKEVYALHRQELFKRRALSALLLLSVLGILASPLIVAISMPLGLTTIPILVAMLVLSIKAVKKINMKLTKEIEKRDAKCAQIVNNEVEELLWYP